MAGETAAEKAAGYNYNVTLRKAVILEKQGDRVAV